MDRTYTLKHNDNTVTFTITDIDLLDELENYNDYELSHFEADLCRRHIRECLKQEYELLKSLDKAE